MKIGTMVFCKYQNRSSDQEFATFLRSLEQFILTVKGQNNIWFASKTSKGSITLS